jgi:hypothetical protein
LSKSGEMEGTLPNVRHLFRGFAREIVILVVSRVCQTREKFSKLEIASREHSNGRMFLWRFNSIGQCEAGLPAHRPTWAAAGSSSASNQAQDKLSAVKRFRETGRGCAFDAPNTMHGFKRAASEPMFVRLSSEMLKKQVDLLGANLFGKRHKEIRAAEVAVVLDDFVLQDEMSTEGVPSQIGEHTMILMPVIAIMCEDDVRIELGPDLFKSLLDCLTLIREEACPEFLQFDRAFSSLCEELEGASFGLRISRWLGAKDNPSHFERGIFVYQRKDSAAAADFDIVGMSPETKDTFAVVQRQGNQKFSTGLVRAAILMDRMPRRLFRHLSVAWWSGKGRCHQFAGNFVGI